MAKSEFFRGKGNIEKSLEDLYQEKGMEASLMFAQITAEEHYNTDHKTLYDYGVMVGAIEYLGIDFTDKHYNFIAQTYDKSLFFTPKEGYVKNE